MKSLRVYVIIQINLSAIFDTFQQFCILSTISTMRPNLQLIRVSQFLQQFKLDVKHKPGKKHIISNALSHLANINVSYSNPFNIQLDVLFTYNITLIEIYPSLISRILAGCEADNYWACLCC